MTPRYELRAAASRLGMAELAHVADHPEALPMHRAEARREIRRRKRASAAWLAGFLSRLTERNHPNA